MTEPLEEQLANMTTWHGKAPGLWRRALSTAGLGPARPPWSLWRFLASRIPLGAAASLVVVVIVAALLIVQEPRLGQRPEALPLSGARAPSSSTVRFDYAAPDTTQRFRSPSISELGESRDNGLGLPGLQRHVVRKATIELATEDVRATFLKAAHLVSEADGEYVQESSLTGSGRQAQANLTLRIAADRLSKVLNELRGLGDVVSERTEGRDVTTQVVDLDARLRNERRVEAELLELLENRQNAPLKEILELREKLREIRQEIERVTAQRERLARLVSLATVLVIIRTGDTPADVGGTGIATYFAESCQLAWNKGLVFLADTCAALLRVLVSGLIWWLLVVVAVLAIRRYRRRAATLARD